MLEEVQDADFLTQKRAAREIRDRFGEEFVYKNENRNWAIRGDVLEAFREASGNEIIWKKGTRRWRVRRETDKPGRQQK